jgi:hypothetical protein
MFAVPFNRHLHRSKSGAPSPFYNPTKVPQRLQGKDDQKWKLFELENEERIGSALVHLDRAYTKAAGSTRKEST